MAKMDKYTINDDALSDFIIEIKLSINHTLYSKGAITQEMYIRAKELILKSLKSAQIKKAKKQIALFHAICFFVTMNVGKVGQD